LGLFLLFKIILGSFIMANEDDKKGTGKINESDRSDRTGKFGYTTDHTTKHEVPAQHKETETTNSTGPRKK
jgi:hypothetical protein